MFAVAVVVAVVVVIADVSAVGTGFGDTDFGDFIAVVFTAVFVCVFVFDKLFCEFTIGFFCLVSSTTEVVCGFSETQFLVDEVFFDAFISAADCMATVLVGGLSTVTLDISPRLFTLSINQIYQ